MFSNIKHRAAQNKKRYIFKIVLGSSTFYISVLEETEAALFVVQ